ncbi:hypothetical protein VTN00DRAFT_9450 [Thermoascus crustaceus]|uniref:uncharacterized protein n=1 Tax=Thermoascus crustaceus TaxID=5088 RepID=UPI0037445392
MTPPPASTSSLNRGGGAGCAVDQGVPVIMNNGYLTAEHCKTLGKGTMYACRIKCPDSQGGEGCYNDECLNVDDAAAMNMTSGFCYDYDG